MLKHTLGFTLVGLIWLTILGFIFPMNSLRSKEYQDNPDICPYYITIQSILANSILLESDKANAKLIKTRLTKFETEIQNSPTYKNEYYHILNLSGFNTIATVKNEGEIINLARATASIVDNYYLDKINCTNPLYTWNTAHTLKHNIRLNSRRILQYNLAGIYDQIPNRYLRILGASQDEFQLGVFSGFFVNNQTTILNIQLMTGIPMLTALYVLPGNDFAHMGSYLAVVPWNSFYSPYFTNENMRRIMNIAGIDVFTVETSDADWQKIPGTIPVPFSINKTFTIASELHTFINTESYGMAYLANHVIYQDPKEIKPYEKAIKQFYAHGAQDVGKFKFATNALYGKLNLLKEKHDIILEVPPRNQINMTVNTNNSTVIKGIVGERAVFTSDCLQQNCTFVFNSAKAPGWFAFVNGKAATIRRANFAFMAVNVPNGHSVIWFIYQSWASLLSYLLSIGCLIWIFFRKVENNRA